MQGEILFLGAISEQQLRNGTVLRQQWTTGTDSRFRRRGDTVCRQDIFAIYGPLIDSAPYVMFLMLENPLRGQVGGGWALESRLFWAL